MEVGKKKKKDSVWVYKVKTWGKMSPNSVMWDDTGRTPYLLVTIVFRISMLRKFLFTYHIFPLISESTYLIFYYEIGLTFSKSSLYIWMFSVCVLLEPNLKDFENYFASMWNECNYVVVWTFFGIAFLWDWNENGPFSVL